jgi:hypothetical protein
MTGSSSSSSPGDSWEADGSVVVDSTDEEASGLSTSMWVVLVALFPFASPVTGRGSGFAGTY